jgi:GTP-binding protein
LAPVSKNPGRTQALGCFALEQTGTTLVDCPGYGYARLAKATSATWLPMVESYLLEREHLQMVLLLVDGEIGPTATDVAMLEWLRSRKRAPFRGRDKARQGQALAAQQPSA